MATYTSNYAWTKPSGNDNVDISVLNANLDSQDSIMHDAFANMAQTFSESSTYEVGDIVVYGTTTYKCHTPVTTPGSWTGSTNWQVYKLSEGGSGGGGTSDYPDLTNKPQINGVELIGNKTASQLGMANSNTFQGTIAEWNQLSTAEKKAYDHASIPDSIDGGVTFPANKVVMTGGGNVEDKFEEIAETPRGYEVIATFTGDGVKTYADVITAFLPYISQADLLRDGSNVFYPRTTATYFSINISSSGSIVIYTIRLDATNPYWKTISVSGGTEVDYLNQVVPSGRVIQLCKKL